MAASGGLNAQAEQMKSFVEDLVKVVGGNGHASSSRGDGGGFPVEWSGDSFLKLMIAGFRE